MDNGVPIEMCIDEASDAISRSLHDQHVRLAGWVIDRLARAALEATLRALDNAGWRLVGPASTVRLDKLTAKLDDRYPLTVADQRWLLDQVHQPAPRGS